jgi:hypothetical protein
MSKQYSVGILNAQKKRTRQVRAKLDRCERKLARALIKLDAANRELKALRKLQPRKRQPKIIDGVFSVVSPMQQIERKEEQTNE